MKQEQRETIARLALEKYGHTAQLRQLQEECAELIAAVNHYFRRGTRGDLIEELADVTIMLMQLTPPWNLNGELSRMIDSKLEKLSHNVEYYGNH